MTMSRKHLIFSFSCLFLIIVSCRAQDGQFQYRRLSESEIRPTVYPIKDYYAAGMYDATKSLPRAFDQVGNTDYTKQLQAALNSHQRVMLPNFPVLISPGGLKL